MRSKDLYKSIYTLVVLALIGLVGCSVRDEYESDAHRNYRALWELLDKRYSYFDLKLPEGTTWEDLYYKHLPKVRQGMSPDSLFDVMVDLMRELRDGHLNLSTPFDYGRDWRWYQDYPSNYNSYVAAHYLGSDYRIAGGLRYTQLKYNGLEPDSVGYLRLGSFSPGPSASNISAALSRLTHCKALVIDIRDNGGGNVTSSDLLARHFLAEERLVGYVRHKVGPGHSDFSAMTPITLKPITQGVRWLRPCVVLTNRAVYSAANDFVLRMKDNPFVTIIGDTTGGGGGLPMTSELPNGWAVRYSSTQTFDAERRHIEQGIAPHYTQALSDRDVAQGRDSLIEYAVHYLREKLKEYKQTKVWTK